MAKITAWLITLIGVVLILPLLGLETSGWGEWVIALAWLVIGVTKLARNYKTTKKK
jgi:hypothetical protein